MAVFGGIPSKCKIELVNSYKTIVFTSLSSGLIIWASYQGSLTSELAIKVVKYPFQDLQSFSKSNYK